MAFPDLGKFSTFGYQNVYIPGYMGDSESQKRYLVGFTLNEEKYALNNIVTVAGVDKPKFFYQRFYSQDFVRVPHAAGIDLRWADGADRPRAQEGPRFTNEPVEVFRYGDMTFLGDMAEDVSDMGSLITFHQTAFSNQFMIRRAIAAHTELTTSTNYPTAGTTHYYATWTALIADDTAQGYSSGYFGTSGTHYGYSGTLTDPLLGKMIKHGVKQIQKRTNGQVTQKDLVLYMNPNTADRLANSQEIRTYLAQQAGSLAVLQGKEPSVFDTMGLPTPLYGLKVLVDPTVKVTTKQDHTNDDTQQYVVQDGLISIIARPGSVTGIPGSAPFGSLTLWQHKKYAMKPSTFPDPENRRVKIGFEDMYAVKLVAPEATFTIANAFA